MSTSNPPAVELRSVCKKVGRTTVLDDVNLDVPEGAAFGLIGRNGSGKTALLSVLSTLVRPTSGTVNVFGIDAVRKRRQVREMIGYVPAEIGAYEDLRVEDHLRFYAGAYRVSPTRWIETIDGLLELVDLTSERERLVGTLSRGMLQRLSLARAMVHEPKLLILDEPASGLDPTGRADLRLMLETLRDRGTTIVLSSHDMADLDTLCTHVGVLRDGRIVVDGAIGEVAKHRSLVDLFDQLVAEPIA